MGVEEGKGIGGRREEGGRWKEGGTGGKKEESEGGEAGGGIRPWNVLSLCGVWSLGGYCMSESVKEDGGWCV